MRYNGLYLVRTLEPVTTYPEAGGCEHVWCGVCSFCAVHLNKFTSKQSAMNRVIWWKSRKPRSAALSSMNNIFARDMNAGTA